MPTETLILFGVIVAISTFILLSRVPAFAVLFSLLIGFVLSTQASGDIYSFLASLSGFADFQQVQMAILLVPFVLTLIFLKGRVSRSLFLVELLPAIVSTVVLLFLLHPHLDFVKNILDIATNDKVRDYRSAVLVIASIMGLISIWANQPKKHKSGRHHRGKH